MSKNILEQITVLASESGKLGSLLGMLIKEMEKDSSIDEFKKNMTYQYVLGEFTEFNTEMKKNKGWSYAA